MHQEDDILVSEVSTTSETSENLRKPWKPHDLETYVSFPGNLPKRISTETSVLITGNDHIINIKNMRPLCEGHRLLTFVHRILINLQYTVDHLSRDSFLY